MRKCAFYKKKVWQRFDNPDKDLTSWAKNIKNVDNQISYIQAKNLKVIWVIIKTLEQNNSQLDRMAKPTSEWNPLFVNTYKKWNKFSQWLRLARNENDFRKTLNDSCSHNMKKILWTVTKELLKVNFIMGKKLIKLIFKIIKNIIITTIIIKII